MFVKLSLKINRGTLRLFSEVLCDKIFLAIFFAGIAQLLLGIICFSDKYNSVCILNSRIAAALIFASITDLDWQGLYGKIRINLRKLKHRKIHLIDNFFLLFSYSLFYPPGLQETWSTVSRKYLIWIDIHVSQVLFPERYRYFEGGPRLFIAYLVQFLIQNVFSVRIVLHS